MEADAVHRCRTSAHGRATGHEPSPSHTPEEIINGLRRHRAHLLSELDLLIAEDDVGRAAPMPYGDVPITMALQIFVMEAGVHASDLAAALDLDDALDDDVAAATWEVLAAFIPTLAAAATEVPPNGVVIRLVGSRSELQLAWEAGEWVVGAEAVEPDTVIAGDDSTALLFALGRLPETDRRLRVSGNPDLAARFKRYVPGP